MFTPLLKPIGLEGFLDGFTERVTVLTYTNDGTRDARGNLIWTEVENADIPLGRAFQTNTRAPAMRVTEIGDFPQFATEFYSYHDLILNMKITPGSKHPVIKWVDGKTYRILEVEPMPIGVARAICEIERT